MHLAIFMGPALAGITPMWPQCQSENNLYLFISGKLMWLYCLRVNISYEIGFLCIVWGLLKGPQIVSAQCKTMSALLGVVLGTQWPRQTETPRGDSS